MKALLFHTLKDTMKVHSKKNFKENDLLQLSCIFLFSVSRFTHGMTAISSYFNVKKLTLIFGLSDFRMYHKVIMVENNWLSLSK